MPTKTRFKTKYPGVYYIEGTAVGSNKPERIYYIVYRRGGKLIEEKAGRQFQDDMTSAKAAQMRTNRIQGDQPSNKEKRESVKAEKEAERNKWTIDKLWTEYLSGKPGLKGKTTDKNRYEKHIKPYFADKEPNEIYPLDIDRLRIKLLKDRKPNTVRNVLELIRRIVNFGCSKNLCAGLRFTIEMPKVNNLKTEDLTPEQLARLLDAIREDKNLQAANFMRMVLFTGMRRGELFRLKWEDIDFERGFIHIRDPKGGRDEAIPLNNEARTLLETHVRTDSVYVFPGRDNNQRIDIKHQVNRIRDRAGLPEDFRALHGLRHVYASMLASSGKVDLYTLQKLLTHKSPVMTQRYAHLRDDALIQASNVVADIINGIMNNGKGEDKPGEVREVQKSA